VRAVRRRLLQARAGPARVLRLPRPHDELRGRGRGGGLPLRKDTFDKERAKYAKMAWGHIAFLNSVADIRKFFVLENSIGFWMQVQITAESRDTYRTACGRLRVFDQRRYSRELASLTRTAISNEAIRRLMRRAGVTRWSDAVHRHVRVLLLDYLCEVVGKSLIYANHARIGEITSEFIQQAVKLQPGRRLYVDTKKMYDKDITQDSKAFICDRVHLTAQKYGAQYKPGWAAIMEVQRSQKGTDLLLRSRPFKHLIDQLGRGFVGCICDSSARHYFIRFKSCAVRALHEAVQDYIVHLMGDALQSALFAKRTLLYPRDIMFTRRIRGEIS
jgi:histone H3/H4